MPHLLRKIRKAKWYKHNDVPWLEEDDLQADALGDLATSSNTLSVWLINEDRSNFDDVIIALASNADTLSHIDYVLLEESDVAELKIQIRQEPGVSPYVQANHWHRDLIELSVSKLMGLAELIRSADSRDRVSEKQVCQLLKQVIESRQIDPARLKERITAKVLPPA